jgi:hypothetical protein
MITGEKYFSDMMFVGHPTKWAALIAFDNFMFCALCSVNTVMARHFMRNEKEAEP